MAETTHDTTQEDTPTGHGYCSWHHRFADDVRLITIIEQGSGTGGAHYACKPCRDAHNLVPFADQP